MAVISPVKVNATCPCPSDWNYCPHCGKKLDDHGPCQPVAPAPYPYPPWPQYPTYPVYPTYPWGPTWVDEPPDQWTYTITCQSGAKEGQE